MAYINKAQTEEWETPQALFDSLDDEFHFTLDPCASKENAKAEKYFTREQDGLLQSWEGEVVFCNPPYGRPIRDWVKKAAEEAAKGATVVMLLPVRTDAAWFHDNLYGKAEIRFIKGRLRFGGATENAPFPNMICILRGGRNE